MFSINESNPGSRKEKDILFTFRFSILILCILFAGCCCSVKNWAESGIGVHIDKLREVDAKSASDTRTYMHKVNWKETTYPLKNGNWVYVTPIRKGCFVHFEVNRDGIIVGYSLEGDRCY